MVLRPSPARIRAIGRGVVVRHRPQLLHRPHPSLQPKRSLHSVSPLKRPTCSPSTISPTRTVRLFQNVAIRRGTAGIHHAASLPRHPTASRLVKNWMSKLLLLLRSPVLAKGVPTKIFNVAKLRFALPNFSSTKPSSSALIRGALAALKSSTSGAGGFSTSTIASRTAYNRVSTPFVTFAHGARSGLGARPAFGPLATSPLKGGVGLQTARKFSSGGARIFDHLVVNAPLALRLAGDEAEDKAKMAAKKRSSLGPGRAIATTGGPRRTGSKFASSKLASNSLKFALAHRNASQKQDVDDVEEIASTFSTTDSAIWQGKPSFTASQKQKLVDVDMSTYFQLPSLSFPSSSSADLTRDEGMVMIRIRLIDPLYDALGGRLPLATPDTTGKSRGGGGGGPRLFDASFLHDAQVALEYEQKRYLQAKALLRVLWDSGILESGSHQMDLFSDPSHWTVWVEGVGRNQIENLLHSQLEFNFDAWVDIRPVLDGNEDGQSSEDRFDRTTQSVERSNGLDLSRPPHPASSEDDASLLLTPPSNLSSSSFFGEQSNSVQTDSFVYHDTDDDGSFVHASDSQNVLSLLHSSSSTHSSGKRSNESQTRTQSPLYDSRDLI